MDENLLVKYKREYGLRRLGGFGSTPCANTLLHGNSRRCRGRHDDCCPPRPVRDHHTGFVAKDGSTIMVFQPYFDYGDDHTATFDHICSVAVAWAEKKGLSCRISEDSWYSPGRTMLIEYFKVGHAR